MRQLAINIELVYGFFVLSSETLRTDEGQI